MLNRRELLRHSAAAGVALAWHRHALPALADDQDLLLNDVQSQLNPTRVRRIETPTSLDELQAALRAAAREGLAVSVAGGRHSMGGQQFGADTVHIDTTRMTRVVRLDKERGLAEVESGIQWPKLIESLHEMQAGEREIWSIREKQTGVDKVCLGAALSSNIHGRGLKYPPFVADVESFLLVDAAGKVRECSRRENAELFSLAVGGYGLFGLIARVTLRLARRMKVQRTVEIIPIRELLPAVDKRLAEGYLFGDCQYSTDLGGEAAEHPGVFSCYKPVPADTPIADGQKKLQDKDWAELYRLARTDKPKAFATYSAYYRQTNGQVYWSDTHQLAGSFEGYRSAVEAERGTEVITEVYVSRDAFRPLLRIVRQDFIDHGVDMTYGTIRFIEQDEETFLPWAKERSVCIVCNLHVKHTDDGKRKAADDFRRIIDRVIEHGGRYFLTYHRHTTRKQVEACYPQFVDFLRLKRKYDPEERFQSDWYRHYRVMFADRLS
jgi:FAD/FMN-containing dehydrogenase